MSHAWDNRSLNDDENDAEEYGSYWGECSDPEDGDTNTEVSAGMEFVSFLLKLLYQATISAHVFAVIMYFAGKAGIKEAVDWGLPPGRGSGRYSRKLKRKLGWSGKTNQQGFLVMEVPGQGKHDIERCTKLVSSIPGHEQLADDTQGIEASKRILEHKKATDDLPLCYHHHPVVSGAQEGECVFPVAIYIDGVPYSITDSVIGIWLINILDGRRYLVSVLRKRLLCMCGCRGWCTFYHFFCMIKWMLEALARGMFPSERYDGDWRDSDLIRSQKAGQPFGFKCACLYMKGDWSELGVTLGFPTWKDGLRPCWSCNACADNFYSVLGVDLQNLTWIINGDDDYFDACSRCEIIVTLAGNADLTVVVNKLRYDKRQGGSRGRALVDAIQVFP